MNPRGGRWRWIYAACAGAVVVALSVVTRTTLALEQEKREEAQQRSALWRLDWGVLPLLSREGARPYFHYLGYYPQECAYSRYLAPISKGDVLVASPLLLAAPPPVRLHFQVDANGLFTSPQAPEGNQRDLAEATLPAYGAVAIDAAEGGQRLARVREIVSPPVAMACTLQIEACESAPRLPQLPQGEWTARLEQAVDAKRAAMNDANSNLRGAEPLAPPPDVDVGTFVPMWIGEPAELFFLRRVKVGEQQLLQGFWCDWELLRATLLASIAELLPGAGLDPLPGAMGELQLGDMSLTTLPARLVAPTAPVAAASYFVGWTATRTTLAIAWLVAVAALAGGWFLVGSSVALGLRRSRFASAVTHELRTPLTTFRMYSEMLADGMVAAPAERQHYLETLKEQSSRLATLVENVLAYARLEEGSGAARRTPTTAAELLARHLPALEQRASDGGFVLRAEQGADLAAARLTTDGDAIGQVLFNLVDNACKYAHGSEPAVIELVASRRGRTLALEVRDHGPGIAPPLRRAIFEPFERGDRNGDPRPGVGLGLALARGVARDLGGDLALDESAPRGAALRLTLPLDP